MMWLFVGAVPLAAATLIWHHRDKESLEAAWKHLFICSVGIVLSLIGVRSMIEASDYVLGHNLSIDTLANYSSVISPLWGGMAFTFALVGYGALMGLSPMHTWLPDAHSKAPSPASALFSGTLQASAFLAILRYYQILSSTLMIPFIRGLLLTLGLISLLTGAVFIPRVDNFRRKLAYSTVAHMGVLATALGLGGFAIYAAILHTLCHSLLKHTLFLTSGNFLYTYGTIKTSGICRGMRRIPQSSVTLVAAALFITGIPTSGIFVSELIIIKQMVTDSRWITLAVFTVLSATAAYGLMKSVFQMVLSKRPSDATASVCDENAEAVKEPVLSLLPQWVFLLIILILGISIPFELNWLLHGAAYILGGY
ncbi:MAG: NADH dehydrogenase FAD-containing subunit [Nitrospirae bacterium]|nr:NADH dehydrogenase FAD-containing subunit [Nitrospirota bacterium]